MGAIMFISKIQYHNVICQGVSKQGERSGFRKKGNPWKWTEVGFSPRGLTEWRMSIWT
jgi:hypothetical protein